MDIENLPELPITQLLIQWQEGNKTAYNDLFILCYQHFRHLIRKEKAKHQNKTKELKSVAMCIRSTTNIVGLAYEKIAGATDAKLDNRKDLNSLISKIVFSIMVDQYRNQTAAKNTLPINILEAEYDINMGEVFCDFTFIDKALSNEKLRCAEIFKLHFFAGLNPKKIADLYKISVRTVQLDLKFATAWYKSNISGRS